jgi:hypothetical protein
MSRFSGEIRARTGFMVALAAVTLGCGSTDGVLNNDHSAIGGGGASSTGTSGQGGGDGGGGGGVGAGCSGQCLPLGPADWLGPALLWMGNQESEAPECPPASPVGSTFVFNDLNAPKICDTCKCDAPSGSCALPVTLTAAASACVGDGPNIPHTSFDASTGWSGSCTAASAIPANQKCNGVNCVQSLTIAPLTLMEAPCAVTAEPVASKLPYTWGAVARTCHGSAFGPCGSPAEVCAPPAPPGFEQCLVHDGDRECPDSYSQKHVFYYGFEDTRACTPCACSTPIGSTCSAFVSVFKDGACSAPVVAATVDATGSACLDVMPSGQALGSKLATAPVYVPGVCQVSGGEPVGTAVPAEPATFCCLPAET